jgi:hypothetical protein
MMARRGGYGTRPRSLRACSHRPTVKALDSMYSCEDGEPVRLVQVPNRWASTNVAWRENGQPQCTPKRTGVGASFGRDVAQAQKLVAIWNSRAQRKARPSFYPTIETALLSGTPWLAYQCPACRLIGDVDLRTLTKAPPPRRPRSATMAPISWLSVDRVWHYGEDKCASCSRERRFYSSSRSR